MLRSAPCICDLGRAGKQRSDRLVQPVDHGHKDELVHGRGRLRDQPGAVVFIGPQVRRGARRQGLVVEIAAIAQIQAAIDGRAVGQQCRSPS
jgi:hypothetical protein